MAGNKRKRERKKASRNKKVPVSQVELRAIDCEWDLPYVYKLIGCIKRGPCYKRPLQMLKEGNASGLAKEMIGAAAYEILWRRRAQAVCALHTMASESIQGFLKTRIGRVASDHLRGSIGLSHSELVSNCVTMAQMRAFLTGLLQRILPDGLLGKRNLLQFVANAIRSFGDLRMRSQVLSYSQAVSGIRYDEIEWLAWEPFAFKQLVAKNLLLFISRILLNIICINFYITENAMMRVLFYRIGVWAKIVKQGLQLFLARGKWQLISRESRRMKKLTRGNAEVQNKPCTFKLRFLPKTSAVRPIVKFPQEKLMVHKLNQVKAILHYITTTKPWSMAFGLSALGSFHPAYRDFFLRSRNCGPLYWAAGDVSNCFPSIDHQLLEKILRGLLGSGSYVILNCWAVTRAKNSGVKDFWRQVYAAGPSRQETERSISLRKDEALTSNPSYSSLTASQVIDVVRHYVLHAHLKHGALYRANRGIPQGSSLSWMLCNIFLGAVERKIFEQRPKGLFCRRYVDDYIAICESREQLLEFGKQLVQGSAAFGIRFNWEKMIVSSNVRRSNNGRPFPLRRKEKLQCSDNTNCVYFKVTVDYKRYRARRPMFSISHIHPADHFSFICMSIKRLVTNRLECLRACNAVGNTKQQRQLRRNFQDFCFRFYFLQFIRVLHLHLKDAMVRHFLKQLTRWLANRFSGQYLPHMALASLKI